MIAGIEVLEKAERVAAGRLCDAEREVCRLENDLASARERRHLAGVRLEQTRDALALVVAVNEHATEGGPSCL